MTNKRHSFRPQLETLERREVPAAPFLLPDFDVVAVGDFDANGSADFAMQHKATNEGVIWFMEGTRRIEATWITTPGDPWSDIRIAAAGDFDRDGKSDLVFEQKSTAEKGIWLMNGAQRREQIWIAHPSDSPHNYSVAAAGDFDGNGSVDLALEFKPTGDKTIWAMSGTARSEAYWVTRPSDDPNNYAIVAAGDFNSDGRADLVMNFKENGDKAIWLMSGAQRLDAYWIQRAAGDQRDYSVLGVADFSLDGRTDLILYHSPSSDLHGWIMNGVQRSEAIWFGRHELLVTWGANGIVITGTSGNDIIRIDEMGQGIQVYANGAYDYLRSGWLSRITVDAGDGHDDVANYSGRFSVLIGGAGNDTIVGGSGRDELYGKSGDDLLDGCAGDDYLNGDESNDTLRGGNGHDEVYGGSGDDRLEGNDGNDALEGGAGNDTLIGGRGDDRYRFPQVPSSSLGDSSAWQLDQVIELPGQALEGADTLDFSALTMDLKVDLSQNDVFASTFFRAIYGQGGNFEIVIGGAGNDTIRGSNGSEHLYGGAGNDMITSLGGVDRLYGDAGNDTLVALDGVCDDYVEGGSGRDSIWVDENGKLRDVVVDDWSAADFGGFIHAVARFSNAGADRTLDGDRIADPRTTTGTRYARFSNNPLFSDDGPSAVDVRQGGLGDCWLMAGLGSIAQSNSTAVRNMVVDFQDGTYGVHLGKNFYRVDDDLPVANGSNPTYAALGRDNSMWVAIVEKAFAHFRRGNNSYSALVGGWGVEVNRAFGTASPGDRTIQSFGNATNLGNEIALRVQRNEAVSVGFTGIARGAALVNNHMYVVNRVVRDVSGRVAGIELRNPWGVDGAGNDGNANDGLVLVTPDQLFRSAGRVNWGRV